MKLICLGDVHARKKRPRNRLDNYWETFLDKLSFVYQYAKTNGIEYILQPGDLFDSAKASHEVVAGVAQIMQQFENQKMICCTGQHDLHFHNPNNPNIPINVLRNAGLVSMGENGQFILDNTCIIHIAGWGADIPKPTPKYYNILLTHRMMIPDGEPLWHDQEDYDEGNAFLRKHDFDLVVSGDNHNMFIASEGDQFLINAGSLMRSSTSQLDHVPGFGVYDTFTSRVEWIDLPIKPAKEVLDFSKRERELEIDENLNNFVVGLKISMEIGMDYKTNVLKAMEDSDVPSSVGKIIHQVIEEAEI